jgi:hypothetical protein
MRTIRVWGIPIHKMLSDTEYVEKTRKLLHLSRKFVWIHVAVLIFLSVLIPWLIDLVQKMIDLLPDEDRKLAWAGLLAGFIFGAVIAQYVVMAMQSIVASLDLFNLNRSTKLLIKYHDTLEDRGILEPEEE